MTDLELIRLYINEPTTDPYPDATIQEILDENGGNVTAATAVMWGLKAARYADLVDVAEFGTSRKLSDLHKHAAEQEAKWLAKLAAETAALAAVAKAPRTRQIVRP